jgi:hypothetical protein
MNAARFGLDANFAQQTDLPFILPEAATPKAGPSAGISLALAIASALLNQPVRGDIAMTGENYAARTRVPIGGLKEKVMAAYRAGIKRCFSLHKIRRIWRNRAAGAKRVKMVPVEDMAQVSSWRFTGKGGSMQITTQNLSPSHHGDAAFPVRGCLKSPLPAKACRQKSFINCMCNNFQTGPYLAGAWQNALDQCV